MFLWTLLTTILFTTARGQDFHEWNYDLTNETTTSKTNTTTVAPSTTPKSFYRRTKEYIGEFFSDIDCCTNCCDSDDCVDLFDDCFCGCDDCDCSIDFDSCSFRKFSFTGRSLRDRVTELC